MVALLVTLALLMGSLIGLVAILRVAGQGAG
jgi:hypothetical protein